MSMNDTPSGERVHIGFFGRRNAGKSSVVNAVTGQNLAIVSETKGTTTDPVYKAMELLPLGPVMIIDTPGFDDEGALGEQRVRRTKQVLNKADIAVLVVDAAEGLKDGDKEMLALFREKQIPYVAVFNKKDLLDHSVRAGADELYVSAATGEGIYELKERLAHLKPDGEAAPIISDLIHGGDFVVLVVPIDSAAPKGRLILPQQQTIREVLDADCTAVVVKENEVAATLAALGKRPSLVVTDSQAFSPVAAAVPESIRLTSFSILMARHKGFLRDAVQSVVAVETLCDGDTILIAEGCTHHRQCEDIGTVKLPGWIREFTDAKPEFSFTSGGEFPEDLSGYSLVVHCGGCMLNEREVMYRMERALIAGVPFTNYGTLIAHMNGILRRCLEIFDI